MISLILETSHRALILILVLLYKHCQIRANPIQLSFYCHQAPKFSGVFPFFHGFTRVFMIHIIYFACNVLRLRCCYAWWNIICSGVAEKMCFGSFCVFGIKEPFYVSFVLIIFRNVTSLREIVCLILNRINCFIYFWTQILCYYRL